MSTIGTALKLVLGCEDTLGKVLAGSTGKGVRALFEEAGGSISKFVHLTDNEVRAFEAANELATDVFAKAKVDKNVIKGIQKEGGNYSAYYQKLVKMAEAAKAEGGLTPDALKKIFGENIEKNADDIVAAAAKSGETAVVEEGAKGGIKALGSKIGSFLKGKGGTIAIGLSVLFELPSIFQAFKNGDGGQQIGRSVLNIGGCAAGAAAGAAIGSIIPVAGTAVGAVVGFLAGALGGMAGSFVAQKAGNALFGESIEDQKEAAAEKLAEQQEAIARNPYAMNTVA